MFGRRPFLRLRVIPLTDRQTNRQTDRQNRTITSHYSASIGRVRTRWGGGDGLTAVADRQVVTDRAVSKKQCTDQADTDMSTTLQGHHTKLNKTKKTVLPPGEYK